MNTPIGSVGETTTVGGKYRAIARETSGFAESMHQAIIPLIFLLSIIFSAFYFCISLYLSAYRLSVLICQALSVQQREQLIAAIDIARKVDYPHISFPIILLLIHLLGAL